MDVLTQLNRAMKYIEAHLGEDIELDNVATVTTYSAYHFGRLFYYIAEMPLSEYIRKRKLSLAAMALQSSQVKVADLAVQYGYDSADSFTRAFVKQPGVTPTAARQWGFMLRIYPPLTFQIRIKGMQEMNWRIEEREAFEVYGIERIFKQEELGKIADFWDECLQSGRHKQLEVDADALYAIMGYGDAAPNAMPYMICGMKRADSDTKGFTTVQVPKRTWAVFRAEGLSDHSNEHCQIPQLFNRAYSEWLPTSGYDKVDGPDMEVYSGPDATGKCLEEVWIPVV
ncbi:helix-turn-helix domain-containing protein [Paenibacillus rhizovicinus]|uniref:Helix-turn-helix domain-containing protein n=1 Tax=Paenibacillus rhizovicinus TaxID=2704463 RepID=A0A6C0NYE2_9BACL|nr:GyrI-like domain-containing protein [Paenibacillus rhizovicinus]QHW31264.1 helix-turn-helix domain-containing protein [Paenibacillus rhizovicinus]